jgi:uncharacterized protein (DUF433 family)
MDKAGPSMMKKQGLWVHTEKVPEGFDVLQAIRDDREGRVERITIEAGQRSGQPCIRGLRITVWDVLSWLAAGMTEREILDDYPELEAEDFRAVYEFAARMGQRLDW